MTTTTIRVSTKTQQTLRQLAQRAGMPMQEVVEQALELYRRKQLLDSANVAYAALRQDSTQWQEWTTERDEWDATVADGLEDE